MANNNDSPGAFHEVPASKYWYLGDTIGAVPKNFFKFFTTAVVIITASSTAVACLTDWWQRFFVFMASYFYIQHWYIGWPITLLSIGIFAIWYNYKKKRRGVKTKIVN